MSLKHCSKDSIGWKAVPTSIAFGAVIRNTKHLVVDAAIDDRSIVSRTEGTSCQEGKRGETHAGRLKVYPRMLGNDESLSLPSSTL